MKFLTWFGKQQLHKTEFSKLPVHVAIIMDGNGRWAKARGLSRSAGHRAGLDRVKDAVEACLEAGVQYLTLFAFSTENWQRPTDEVDFLMKLFSESMASEVAKLHKHGVRIRFIGGREKLDPSLTRLIEGSETLTQNNRALTLNIAVNYGGRAELVRAVREISRRVSNEELTLEQVTEAEIAKYLFTAGQPDPDLLIKPGGEFRISNFLIWQMAYTEFYFTKLYWPDFGKNEMFKAFQDYSSRDRRFGAVKEGKKPI
jgi:undecaprenyl diphosphate synthase